MNPRSLTPAQKKQIRRYDAEIISLKARGVRVYRARNPKNLKAVQAFAQHGKGFPQLRVAFVPVADPTQPTRIRVNKRGTVHVVSQGIARNVYMFRKFERLPGERLTEAGMLAVIKRILAVDKVSRVFSRICGKYEEKATWARNAELIAKKCSEYIEGYGNHRRWFDGLIGYNFIAQADFSEYRSMRGILAKKSKKRQRRPPRNSRENER